jgi:hypothetical protein
MNPEEIKYYRTKAVGLLDHKYEDFLWSSSDDFSSQDNTVDSNVRKLRGLPPGKLYGFIKPYVAPAPLAESGIFTEQVSEAKGILSQPNAETCQSTCIVNSFGGTQEDILDVRSRLVAMPGGAGDPYNMGVILTERFGDRYIFDDNACLSEIREWLRAGEFLITHGWFTGSGHVICLDGVTIDASNLSYKISVKDPWSEFNFGAWAYDNSSVDRYDGDYSAHGLYAAIVASVGVLDAIAIYQKRELDSMRKGAWIHRILPAKKA